MIHTPQGAIYLLTGVIMDNTYEHQIDFGTAIEQREYFMAKTSVSLTDYTYVRKDNVIKVPINYEDMYAINYVMYRNYNSSKWVYAFITSKQYVNEGMTLLTIETDVFQTYMFDYTWGDTFIDREHVDRWEGYRTPIYSLTDENLFLGEEYAVDFTQSVAVCDKYYLITCTEPLHSDTAMPVYVQNYPTPFHYYLIPTNGSGGVMGAQDLCTVLAGEPKVISVSLIMFLPFELSALTAVSYTADSTTYTLYHISQGVTAQKVLGNVDKFFSATIPSQFSTGVPRHYMNESKLLCYPYSYLMLTDYQSEPLILKTEYLNGDSIEIKCTQLVSHTPKVKYWVSSGYLGESNGKNHNVVNDKQHELPLLSDSYINYMYANKNQSNFAMGMSAIRGVGGLAMGALTGGLGLLAGAGTLVNSAEQIGNELMKRKDLENIPRSVSHNGNNLCFDLADENMVLKIVQFSVAESVKEMLGDYFAKYGYKSSKVKVPELRSRYYYNYIKTIGCNIDGNMDMLDISKLKSIYNNGVTIWHNRDGVVPLSYEHDNVEINLI